MELFHLTYNWFFGPTWYPPSISSFPKVAQLNAARGGCSTLGTCPRWSLVLPPWCRCKFPPQIPGGFQGLRCFLDLCLGGGLKYVLF